MWQIVSQSCFPLPQEVVEAPRDLLWNQTSPLRQESHGITTDTIVSVGMVGREVKLPPVETGDSNKRRPDPTDWSHPCAAEGDVDMEILDDSEVHEAIPGKDSFYS